MDQRSKLHETAARSDELRRGPLRQGAVVARKYELQELIAKGGMGTIWRAHDQLLERPVAVKFMDRTIAADETLRERFVREAKAAARLRTMHVVQIYDFGIESDVPFIVMELLEGEDLHATLKRQAPMALEEVAWLVGEIAKGLQSAHDSAVVHRDLKPQNVFLSAHANETVVKILDFGVAKLRGADFSGFQTAIGTVLGSPNYMSPEQARGKPDIDHRADLWSLAVIAFRAVTGKLAFPGDMAAMVILKICVEPLPVPSQVLPGLPREMDAFFERAMQREPAMRFQTALELANAFTAAARFAGAGPPRPIRYAAQPRAVGASKPITSSGVLSSPLRAAGLTPPPHSGTPASGGSPAPWPLPVDTPVPTPGSGGHHVAATPAPTPHSPVPGFGYTPPPTPSEQSYPSHTGGAPDGGRYGPGRPLASPHGGAALAAAAAAVPQGYAPQPQAYPQTTGYPQTPAEAPPPAARYAQPFAAAVPAQEAPAAASVEPAVGPAQSAAPMASALRAEAESQGSSHEPASGDRVSAGAAAAQEQAPSPERLASADVAPAPDVEAPRRRVLPVARSRKPSSPLGLSALAAGPSVPPPPPESADQSEPVEEEIALLGLPPPSSDREAEAAASRDETAQTRVSDLSADAKRRLAEAARAVTAEKAASGRARERDESTQGTATGSALAQVEPADTAQMASPPVPTAVPSAPDEPGLPTFDFDLEPEPAHGGERLDADSDFSTAERPLPAIVRAPESAPSAAAAALTDEEAFADIDHHATHVVPRKAPATAVEPAAASLFAQDADAPRRRGRGALIGAGLGAVAVVGVAVAVALSGSETDGASTGAAPPPTDAPLTDAQPSSTASAASTETAADTQPPEPETTASSTATTDTAAPSATATDKPDAGKPRRPKGKPKGPDWGY